MSETEAGRTLLRQWRGHPNEPEVAIVIDAIERQARQLTIARINARIGETHARTYEAVTAH